MLVRILRNVHHVLHLKGRVQPQELVHFKGRGLLIKRDYLDGKLIMLIYLLALL